MGLDLFHLLVGFPLGRRLAAAADVGFFRHVAVALFRVLGVVLRLGCHAGLRLLVRE